MLDYTYLDDTNKQVVLQRANNTAELVLLKRISLHDRDAFHQIFSRYYPQLQHFISQLIKSPQLVDQISNEVLVLVWQQACHFKGQSRVSTWIFRLAYKKTLKSIKNLALNALNNNLDAQTHHSSYNSDCDLNQNQQVLTCLSFEHQALLLLTCINGFSALELADIMACPLSKIEARMSQTRKQLHQILPQLDTEYETERL